MNLGSSKCKKALYCHKDHKDYQGEKGYECHIFHYKGTSNPCPYTQRQVNECKVLQESMSNSNKNFNRRRVSVEFICHMAGSVTLFLKEQGDYFLEILSRYLDILFS